MKTHSFILPVCSLLLALPAMGDIFVLKDGSRLEGSILREEGDNYVLEVQITKSIRDEKTVPKSSVVKVEKEQRDLPAFQQIKGLIPVPDMLTSEDYANRISMVNGFINAYPSSSKVPEAKAMLEALKAEADAVAAGGVKLDGKIIPAKEYQANAYDIDANRQLGLVRSASARHDYIGALRAYDSLETQFKGSKAYESAIPVVLQVLDSYEKQVKAASEALTETLKKRQTGLERMSPGDRANASAALAEEEAGVNARFQKEKADRQNWVTVSATHKASLDDATRAITSARSKLSSYRPGSVSPKEPGELYRAAWAALETREKRAYTSAISAVKSTRIPARYIDPLTRAAAAMDAELAAVEAKAKADAEAEKAAQKAKREKAEEAREKREAARAAREAQNKN